MRFLWICLILSWACAQEELIEDQWYAGTLNAVQAVSMRAQTWRRDDGTFRTSYAMRMLVGRAMGGLSKKTDDMEISSTSHYVEDALGRIVEFRIEEDQNGIRTIANGTITASGSMAVISGTVTRGGRSPAFTETTDAALWPLGEQASWRLLSSASSGTLRFASIGLLNSKVQLLRVSAQVNALPERAGVTVQMTPEEMPLPMTLHIDAQGKLRSMSMNMMGIMKLELQPVDAAPVLTASTIDAGALVKHVGAAPRQRARNVYVLPAGAQIPETPFQSASGSRLTVLSHAAAQELSSASRATLLAVTPSLEIDDPRLRAWVAKLLGDLPRDPQLVAKGLCDATRTHISKKDLSQGDASALETLLSKRGDCTEHANLLCAALRIADIPARVEVGIVYAAELGGWGGHAWVSAYVGGQWQHLDAAYVGIPRSMYISLGSPSDSVATAMLSALSSMGGKTLRIAE